MSNSNNYDEIFRNLVEEGGGPCQACGGRTKPERVNLEELEAGKVYLMENVPAMVCEDCGEMWVPETVLKDFEKMINTAQKAHKTEKKKSKKKK